MTIKPMNTKLLLKSLAVVAVSILVAGVFHIGWLAAFIPAAKSGVMALKIVGWLAAPVVTAVGYAAGLWMGERLLTHEDDRLPAYPRVAAGGLLAWSGGLVLGRPDVGGDRHSRRWSGERCAAGSQADTLV